MSESRPAHTDDLRIVAAIGREFERVIERERAHGRRPLLAARAPRLAMVCLGALLAFTLLTAPGKEAAAWVGELVGIGEVGGPPTEDKRGFEDRSSRSGPVVIDNGRAPDGTRYEWVAYPCKVDLRAEGQPGAPVRGLGLALEWPGVKGHEGGGVCEGPRGKHERIPVIGGFGVHIVPSQFKGVAKPDVVVSGTVGAEAARRVRVVYRDARGQERDLAVDFARVDGGLRERAGRGAPAATFVAFVDGEQASRDRLEDCLDLRALETVAGRHPVERCAELHPEVRAFRARLEKCGAGRRQRPAAEKRIPRCVGPPPPSPLRVIVYDANGRRLSEQPYPLNIPAPTAAPPLGEPPYRGRGNATRGRPPLHPGAAGAPVVLASGRTPDGVPYEYLAQKFVRRGKVYSVCLMRWYPYSGAHNASGHCGRGFPPTKAYGKAWPRRVVARSFGFLGDDEPATGYLSLQGFTRARVARVRVVYKDGRGGKGDAPVEFVRVRGALQRRVGSPEPFGFFATYLPPSVRRYYRGPDRPKGPPAIEVIAYDPGGKEIGRFKHGG